MDKATYDAIRAVLRPYFRGGGTLENAIEAVRAAQLDVEDEKRLADVAAEHKALGSMEEADAASGLGEGA